MAHEYTYAYYMCRCFYLSSHGIFYMILYQYILSQMYVLIMGMQVLSQSEIPVLNVNNFAHKVKPKVSTVLLGNPVVPDTCVQTIRCQVQLPQLMCAYSYCDQNFLQVLDFHGPFTLPATSDWHRPFALQFQPTSSECLFNTTLRLSTNASLFNIPFYCYDGRVTVRNTNYLTYHTHNCLCVVSILLRYETPNYLPNFVCCNTEPF